MTHSPTFHIDQWAAFAPGISSTEQWHDFFANKINIDPAENADVAFIPAMQRRRLSPLARAAFSVTEQVTRNAESCPTIFASISGETHRTFELLSSIARNEGVSPTSFSLSVHNAIAGQWSILQKNTCPSIAVAPNADHYLLPFAEAIAQLYENEQSIVLVYYEESLPEFYRAYTSSIDFPCALAIKISRTSTGPQCQFHQHTSQIADNTQPHPILALIHFLSEEKAELHIGYTGLTRK